MKNYHPGEIVLLSFPFSDSVGVKIRPALVLIDSGDEDVIAARITGHASKSPYDIELKGWKEAGLLLPSIVKINKISTLEKSLVIQKIGIIGSADFRLIKSITKELWSDFIV